MWEREEDRDRGRKIWREVEGMGVFEEVRDRKLWREGEKKREPLNLRDIKWECSTASIDIRNQFYKTFFLPKNCEDSANAK